MAYKRPCLDIASTWPTLKANAKIQDLNLLMNAKATDMPVHQSSQHDARLLRLGEPPQSSPQQGQPTHSLITAATTLPIAIAYFRQPLSESATCSYVVFLRVGGAWSGS